MGPLAPLDLDPDRYAHSSKQCRNRPDSHGRPRGSKQVRAERIQPGEPAAEWRSWWTVPEIPAKRCEVGAEPNASVRCVDWRDIRASVVVANWRVLHLCSVTVANWLDARGAWRQGPSLVQLLPVQWSVRTRFGPRARRESERAGRSSALGRILPYVEWVCTRFTPPTSGEGPKRSLRLLESGRCEPWLLALALQVRHGRFDTMEHINRHLIRALWEGRPKDIRSAPATETSLLQFESESGSIPEDFRWFLKEWAGGSIHSQRRRTTRSPAHGQAETLQIAAPPTA